MNHKATFANELSEWSPSGLYNGDTCFRYGITWGCDGDCPIFHDGDCKMDDIDALREMIMTTDRFDDYSIEELNKMYPQ